MSDPLNPLCEHQTVQRDRAAVSGARRWVTDRARKSRLRVDVGVVELLSSELITNAVRYGGDPVVVSLPRDDRCFTVRVTDAGHASPHVVGAHPTALGGRGLMLVNLLSSAWGVDRTRASTSVWFSMRGQ